MHILAFWLNMLITSEKNNYTSQPVTNRMGLPWSQGGWFNQSQTFMQADTKHSLIPNSLIALLSWHISIRAKSQSPYYNFAHSLFYFKPNWLLQTIYYQANDLFLESGESTTVFFFKMYKCSPIILLGRFLIRHDISDETKAIQRVCSSCY